MQPDLPWNVAGIPPEAREAARAAARREGLSVGEWLTRKILRTLSETAGGLESTSDNWRNAAVSSAAAYRTVAESAAAATRDTEDMLARVSRSEDESQSAYKRIEDHLKGVARRLDSAERSQAENNRAMSKAAAEINVAAREQAQAFDQLDGHVMALADRLTRVEQHASNPGIKDAVKGLHTGLSRLADQIGETANQSATQIATLAQNIESLATRLAQARQEAETTSKALRDHLLAVDARVETIEKDESTSQALNDLGALRETLDGLGARFGESEAQTSGAMARLENSVGQLQHHVEDSGFDGRLANFEERLAGIEHAIADLSARFEAEHNGADDALHEELRQLNERLDAADRQHRREIADLHQAIEEIEAANAAAPAPAPEPAPPAPAESAPMQPPPPATGFDLPPFPQAQAAPPFPAQHDADPFAAGPDDPASPPPFEPGAGLVNEHQFSGVQQFDTVLGHGPGNGLGNGFDHSGMNGYDQPSHSAGPTAESYIAATRQQARAAAAEAQAAPAGSSFSWGTPAQDQTQGGGRKRYVLIGAIAVILIAALAAAFILLRTVGQAPQPAQTPATGPARSQSQAAPAMVGSTIPAPHKTVAPPATTPQSDAPEKTASTQHNAHAKPAPRPTHKPEPVHHASKPAPKKVAAISPMEKLVSAAKAGSPAAETVLGLKYLDGDGVAPNEAEGARWLERAAKQGQPVAEYRLGTLYERGHGVPADPKQAAMWYEAAAKQGNRKAMHNLAVAYAQGAGVPKSYTVAAQWFAKAARLGLKDSQFNLAVLYERGMGVPQNLAQAYKWYAIAASQGDSESKARVSALATQLKPSQRAAAQRAAETFRPAPLNRSANVPPTQGNI